MNKEQIKEIVDLVFGKCRSVVFNDDTSEVVNNRIKNWIEENK